MIIPVLALANPGPVTRELMEEPASLFDVGMLRLKHSIGYWEKQIIGSYNRSSRIQAGSQPNWHNSSGNVNIAYDHKDDKIYISLSVRDKLPTQAQMQAGCKSGLKEIEIIVRKSGPSFFDHQTTGLSSTSPSFYVGS
jgi:hypothetical protein